MSEILANEKEIVVPGQVIARGMDIIPNGAAFRESEDIICCQVGIVTIDGRTIKVIPIRGKYSPKPGDVVIGRIVDMSFSNWYVDIGSPSDAVLSVRGIPEFVNKGDDLAQYYSFGDIIAAQIISVTRSSVELTMKEQGLRKLGPGLVINVDSSKVPRVIGKKGSMITLIKDKTGCRITVGQNGVAWIQGDPKMEIIASKVIKMINEESHKEGLTEIIGKRLDEMLQSK